ncbi:hypothetical protein K360107B91_06230 [Enterocloster bolteae]
MDRSFLYAVQNYLESLKFFHEILRKWIDKFLCMGYNLFILYKNNRKAMDKYWISCHFATQTYGPSYSRRHICAN